MICFYLRSSELIQYVALNLNIVISYMKFNIIALFYKYAHTPNQSQQIAELPEPGSSC